MEIEKTNKKSIRLKELPKYNVPLSSISNVPPEFDEIPNMPKQTKLQQKQLEKLLKHAMNNKSAKR